MTHTDAREARPATNGSRFAEFIRSRVQDEHPAWTLSKEWAQLTAVGALVATLVDAFLLDRKYGLISGGFLAPDHLETLGQRALFFLTSLVADAGFLAPVVALGLWVWGRHLRLSAATRGVLTLFVALFPIALTDFVSLHLVDYVGDIVNARVLFELAGRSLSEVVAVAFGHVVRLVAVVAGVAAAIVAFGYFVNRAWPASPLPAPRPPVRRFVLVGIVALALSGAAATAAGRLGDAAVDAGLRRKPTTRWYSSVIQRVTDVDRDGYGLLSRPPDPDPWNAAVHPWAVEIPGNGVDENGVGGDLPAGLPPYDEGSGRPTTWRRRPPFLLAVLETFRGDLVGARDGEREITPVLNGLGRQGVVVARAYSHNGFTAQSRFHIFRGSVAELREGTSLIDDFKANGYETAFMSAQDESFGGPALDVGFYRADKVYDARQDVARRFTQFSTPGSLGIPYYVLLERVEEYLRSRSADRPLFLTVNFQETHFPYYHKGVKPILNDVVVPRDAIGPGRADDLKRMYRNTAANVDLALGQVIELMTRHAGGAPAVVALADHGESLFDDGLLGHGYALDDQQMRIAMAVANLPARVPEPFGQSDLRDVIWQALGEEASEARPTVVPDPSRRVFQYIGSFERPSQIGFVTADVRVSVHMVNLQARLGAAPWRALSSLSADEARRVDELVHFWERGREASVRAGVPSTTRD